jgi:hypothetical protein
MRIASAATNKMDSKYRSTITDVTGPFCTSRNERLSTERTWKDAEEEVYAGADRREVAADRSAGEPREGFLLGKQLTRRFER